MKNVLVYAPFARWPIHFETDLEIIRNKLDQGCKVTVLYCDGSLYTCEPNYDHDRFLCASCKSRFKNGIKWLSSDRCITKSFERLTSEQRLSVEDIRKTVFSSLDEVMGFTLDGAPLGIGAISSTITQFREPKLSIETCRKQLTDHLAGAVMVWYSLRCHLMDDSPDELVLFNGRFASLLPALEAAKSLGIRAYVHERAGALNRYSLSVNSFPHVLEHIKNQIEHVWEESPLNLNEKVAIARSWYKEREESLPQSWVSFTDQQTGGLIPGLNPSVLNICLFNSSEEELEVVPGWKEELLYRDQNEGLQRLIRDLDPSRVHLMLRVHPNLSGISNSQIREIMRIAEAHPELTYIPPESPVSTYALIKAVDGILTFSSTVGIEAVYHGSPSILLGHSMYEDLDGCIRPTSHKELVRLLHSSQKQDLLQMIPDDKRHLSAMKYGFFGKKWGLPFLHVATESIFSARMKKGNEQVRLRASWLPRKLERANRHLRRRLGLPHSEF